MLLSCSQVAAQTNLSDEETDQINFSIIILNQVSALCSVYFCCFPIPLIFIIAITVDTLIINNCEELSLIEEDNQNLKLTLRKLRLSLHKSFWFCLNGSKDLPTLQHLEIENVTISMVLPDWLPSLRSVQTLQITGCPKCLNKRKIMEFSAYNVF